MNKKITMYELLGMVKDGEAPKKIKYKNIIYELNDNKIWTDEVYSNEGKSYIKLNFKHIKSLNDEVEILDDEDMEIEELGWIDYNIEFTHEDFNREFRNICNTIDKLVREINKLKKEGK